MVKWGLLVFIIVFTYHFYFSLIYNFSEFLLGSTGLKNATIIIACTLI